VRILKRIAFRLNLHYLVPMSIGLALTLVLLMRYKLSFEWRETLPAVYVVFLLLFVSVLAQVVYWGVRVRKAFLRTRSYEGSRVDIMYERNIPLSSDELIQMAEQTLCQAELELESSVREVPKPTAVIVSDVSYFRLLGVKKIDFGGKAWIEGNSIYVVYNENRETLEYILRHEWTHLITGQWSRKASPLFSEGISEVIAHLHDLDPLHHTALRHKFAYASISLIEILKQDSFYESEWRRINYDLAGSFVAFLLDRGGLEQFRGFYCLLNDRKVNEAFQQVYGCSLAQMEAEWNAFLFSRQSEEPFQNAVWQAMEDLIWHAVEHRMVLWIDLIAKQMLQVKPSCWLGHFALGLCPYFSGQFQQALPHFEQAAHFTREDDHPALGFVFLLLGQCYDMLSQREPALKAYQQTLELPEALLAGTSSHERAKHYLERPYSWEERFRRLTEEAAES